MKKERKKALGYSLIILGLVLIFLKPLTILTGFSIASESLSFVQDIWFFLVGIGMIAAGIILTEQNNIEEILESARKYKEADTRLKKLLGKKYFDINPKERPAYVKSYRRHFEKVGDEEPEVDTGQITLGGYRIIRTKKFERAVRNHNLEMIQRTIDKIGTGLGKEEPLTGRDDWSIRTTKGGRIIYERDERTRTARLKNYTASHKYDRV